MVLRRKGGYVLRRALVSKNKSQMEEREAEEDMEEAG